MEISIAFQTLVFLKAVVMGVGLGILYDLLRAVRRALHAGVALTAFCDALFWIGTLGAVFIFVLTAAAGEGRSYVLLGAVLGALLYFIALSPPVFILIMLVVRTVLRIVRLPQLLCPKVKLHLVCWGNTSCIHKKTREKLKKLFHFSVKRFKIK